MITTAISKRFSGVFKLLFAGLSIFTLMYGRIDDACFNILMIVLITIDEISEKMDKKS